VNTLVQLNVGFAKTVDENIKINVAPNTIPFFQDKVSYVAPLAQLSHIKTICFSIAKQN